MFYCSSNYFGSLFYPDRHRRCCCGCCCWRYCCCCWCFCHSRSGWLVGTWHVPFPLFVVGRRMNFCVGICALSSVLGICAMYVCICICVSPCSSCSCPVNPFRSLPIDFVDSSVDLPFFAGILVIFLLFLLLCCFVFVFRVTSLFIHYVYWLILDTFGTLYSISAMHFMHSTSHIRRPQTCRLIFHFQFFIFFFYFFCNFALLAKQFSHANFK